MGNPIELCPPCKEGNHFESCVGGFLCLQVQELWTEAFNAGLEAAAEKLRMKANDAMLFLPSRAQALYDMADDLDAMKGVEGE